MVNYQKGKIYKLVCNQTGKTYVGSTTQRLTDRLYAHKSHYIMFNKGTRCYVASFEVLKGGDYNIILVESFPCNSKEELFQRERFWIDELPKTVNKYRRPVTTEEEDKALKAEWNIRKPNFSLSGAARNIFKDDEDKEEELQHKKEVKSKADAVYREENKEELAAKAHQRYIEDEEYRNKEKERSRIWHEEHREEAVLRSKEYYAENKEAIREQQAESYANNPEQQKRSLEKALEWRKKNPEKFKQNCKSYYERNKEKIAAKAKAKREVAKKAKS